MRDYYNDPPETEIAPEDEKVWEILEAAGTDEESIKKVSDIINGLLCEIGRLQNKGEAEYEARAALSTEAQPEVTGAVAWRSVRWPNEDEDTLEYIYTDEPPTEELAWEPLYPPSAIEVAVRERLEEAAKSIEEEISWSDAADDQDELVNRVLEQSAAKVRALMESPHTSVEEPAN